MTRSLSFFALVCILASTAGCGGRSEDADTSTRLVIFSQCNNAEPYRAEQNSLMKQLWAEQENVTLEIMDGQQDNAKQIGQIENAILKKPDLLIVAPNERGPLTKVMGQAMEAGIPVICLERDILQPHYTTYIRSDNEEIGRMAGQFIVEFLKDKHGTYTGKIVHMCGLKGVEGEINRYGGAQEIIDQHPDIEILKEPVANWLQSNAKERMTEVLSVEPEIDLVYGHNDPMAVGAYLAAKEVGREKEMAFVGVDGLQGPAGGIQKVLDGVLDVTFIYPLCVDKAVEIGAQILNDPQFQPEQVYMVESKMVTRENAAELIKK